MFGYGHVALLQLTDRVWIGRPGRSLDSLGAGSAPWFPGPPCLFDKLIGVTVLNDHGVDEEMCGWRHITVWMAAEGSDETVEVRLDEIHIQDAMCAW